MSAANRIDRSSSASPAGAWDASLEPWEGGEQRWLYTGSCVRIAWWRCLAKTARLAGERQLPGHLLVFTHRGAYRLHTRHGSGLVDGSCAALIDPGTPFRTSHPIGCGDAGVTLVVRPDILRHLIGELGGSREASDLGLLEGSLAPCSSRLLLLQRSLVRRLRAAAEREEMGIEETAIDVVAGALADHHAARAKRGERRVQRHTRERIELARELIARRYTEPLRLADLAAACQLSIDRLCRSFRAVTSTTVHRYIGRLRLAAALERLADGEHDLTSLALDLGYSSHSHFTAAFRRELGLPPSAWREGSISASRQTQNEPGSPRARALERL